MGGVHGRGSALSKVPIGGGPTVAVNARRTEDRAGRHGGPDDTIVFATTAPATGLQRVSAARGEPAVLTTPDRKRARRWPRSPEFLPGGEAFSLRLRRAAGGVNGAPSRSRDVRTGLTDVLIPAAATRTTCRPGISVYGSTGALHAVAFDLAATPRSSEHLRPCWKTFSQPARGRAQRRVFPPTDSSSTSTAGRRRWASATITFVNGPGRSSLLPGVPQGAGTGTSGLLPIGAGLALATRDNVSIYNLARAALEPA